MKPANFAKISVAAAMAACVGSLWTSARPAPTTLPAVPKPTPVLKVEEIATGLRAPWSIAFLPDGRVFFTEREGRLRVIDGGRLQPEPIFTVPDLKSWMKMGLLGIALHPDFATNHLLYLAENYEENKNNFCRVVRYREADNHLLEPTRIIDGIPAFWNHTGGRLRFGPDGKLYITTGDADKPPLAQDLHSLAGKILRLNSDGSIPGDNPFVGRTDALPAIWTYGHRNPQGLAFQPGTDTLFAPEHGPDGGDEVNIIRRGNNYGWPIIDHTRTKEGMISPLLEYTPSIAPAAAMFYTGDLIPQFKGDLLVGCLRGEGILRVQLDGDRVVTERLLYREYGRLREVAQAPDGSIWITTSQFDPPDGQGRDGYDKILRLTPTGNVLAHGEAIPDARSLPRPVGATAIYAAHCAGCHGQVGRQGLNSSLFDRKWTICDGSDEQVAKVIHDGSIVRGMPAYEGILTPDETREMMQFIRQNEPKQ